MPVTTSKHTPTDAHIRLHDAFKAAIVAATTDDKMPIDEILAVASKIVGALIAVQDQRKYNSERVMALVIKNIEEGNADMIETVFGSVGDIPPQG